MSLYVVVFCFVVYFLKQWTREEKTLMINNILKRLDLCSIVGDDEKVNLKLREMQPSLLHVFLVILWTLFMRMACSSRSASCRIDCRWQCFMSLFLTHRFSILNTCTCFALCNNSRQKEKKKLNKCWYTPQFYHISSKKVMYFTVGYCLSIYI